MPEFRVGGLLFTSDFDSGNLARVERVLTEEESEHVNFSNSVDAEFNLWTHLDAAGTEFENPNRTWFYFAIKGAPLGKYIRLNIMNLNRQGRLFTQGMLPVVKVLPNKPTWERIRDRPTFENLENGDFKLTFKYRFDFKYSAVYFAFSYPFTYSEYQTMLETLDEKFEAAAKIAIDNIRLDMDTIFYSRELLTESLDGRRIDLLTITSHHGITGEYEDTFPHLFPNREKSRPPIFENKRVYFLSSRVHPGETPSSFVFNGFLKFILRPDDPRAIELRRNYVFKLIPLLNPDGVARGYYRTDQRGVNLNRVYLSPEHDLHPSIYASKTLVVYYHRVYREKFNLIEQDVPLKSKAAVDSSTSPGIDTKQGDVYIDPHRSGIAFFVDLHGHASKRGCFMYGNKLDALVDQVDSLLYPKLMSLNSSYFDFSACNFTERNMFLKDRRDCSSKEGAGRVAFYTQLGIINSYTLECNYNCGRTTNYLLPATNDDGRATPPPLVGYPPKYGPTHYEEVGRALAVSVLDYIDKNPWSRLTNSEYLNVSGVRASIMRCSGTTFGGSRRSSVSTKSSKQSISCYLAQSKLLNEQARVQSKQNVENAQIKESSLKMLRPIRENRAFQMRRQRLLDMQRKPVKQKDESETNPESSEGSAAVNSRPISSIPKNNLKTTTSTNSLRICSPSRQPSSLSVLIYNQSCKRNNSAKSLFPSLCAENTFHAPDSSEELEVRTTEKPSQIEESPVPQWFTKTSLRTRGRSKVHGRMKSDPGPKREVKLRLPVRSSSHSPHDEFKRSNFNTKNSRTKIQKVSNVAEVGISSDINDVPFQFEAHHFGHELLTPFDE